MGGHGHASEVLRTPGPESAHAGRIRFNKKQGRCVGRIMTCFRLSVPYRIIVFVGSKLST